METLSVRLHYSIRDKTCADLPPTKPAAIQTIYSLSRSFDGIKSEIYLTLLWFSYETIEAAS